MKLADINLYQLSEMMGDATIWEASIMFNLMQEKGIEDTNEIVQSDWDEWVDLSYNIYQERRSVRGE
jgi:hypothetical protein